MQHLSYEDLERYIGEEELSEEYLCWLEPVMEHLDSCENCREKINRLMLISEIGEEENAGNVFSLLENEEKIRRELVANLLMQTMRNAKTETVAHRLKAGALTELIVRRENLLKPQVVMRGGRESAAANATGAYDEKDIRVQYENKKVYVLVPCDRTADVTVILALPEEAAARPLMVRAVWSEEQQRAVAEFEIGEFAETYEIYVDIS